MRIRSESPSPVLAGSEWKGATRASYTIIPAGPTEAKLNESKVCFPSQLLHFQSFARSDFAP
jgi:hypothetical protein